MKLIAKTGKIFVKRIDPNDVFYNLANGLYPEIWFWQASSKDIWSCEVDDLSEIDYMESLFASKGIEYTTEKRGTIIYRITNISDIQIV